MLSDKETAMVDQQLITCAERAIVAVREKVDAESALTAAQAQLDAALARRASAGLSVENTQKALTACVQRLADDGPDTTPPPVEDAPQDLEDNDEGGDDATP